MAGQGYEVSVEDLEGVAGQLKAIASEIQRHPVRNLDCAPPAFGHGALASAASHFCDRWQRGITTLVDDSEAVGKLLQHAGTIYHRAEYDAKSLLQKAAEPYWDEIDA